jgi:hypothetical protein
MNTVVLQILYKVLSVTLPETEGMVGRKVIIFLLTFSLMAMRKLHVSVNMLCRGISGIQIWR